MTALLCFLYLVNINCFLVQFPGKSFITILPPIPTVGLTKENLADLIDESYEKMNKAFQESSQEAYTLYMDNLKST